MSIGEGATTGLGKFVLLSIIVHSTLLVVVVFGAQLVHPRRAPPQTVMITKLVRLGVERPPEFLPRIPVAAPPPAPRPAPAVAPQSEPATDSHAPSAKERVAELSQVSNALERLKKQTPVDAEGHPEGVADGEVRSLAQAIAGQKFATEVVRCMKANYAIEGIEPSRVRDKSAQVLVRVAADGRIIHAELQRTSGLEAFDRAVDRAVARCGKVSPPPPELATDVERNGVEVVFQP